MKRVVLVNPDGPRNVGTALRVADNFGPCELVLVAPTRPALLVHPEFEQMSHGVDDMERKLRVVDTIEEALAGSMWSVGFTARVRGDVIREEWNERKLDLIPKADDPEELLTLVFGSEESGLSTHSASLCQELVHIRTSADHTSLNLAISVSIVLQGLFTGTVVHRREPGGHPVKAEERAFLIANLKHIFAEEMARGDESARLMARSIERVFGQTQLSTSDARAWHMVARQLGSKKVPADFGLNPNPSQKAAKRARVETANQAESSTMADSSKPADSPKTDGQA